jgi:hypothetical protein
LIWLLQVTVMVSFAVLLVVGAWGVAQVKDGLDLTDIVPRDTTEFQFLDAQEKYFGFYNIYAVTKVRDTRIQCSDQNRSDYFCKTKPPDHWACEVLVSHLLIKSVGLRE